MVQNFLNKISERAIAERIALFLALIIGLILAIAAWGKLFHPASFVKILDQWVSGFEILFLIIVISFRKRWQMWNTAAVIFAGWSGYALYWYYLKLPCACMGAVLDIPTAISISIDILFFIASMIVGFLLGAPSKWSYFSVLSGLMAALVGYAFADWIYRFLIIGF